MEEIVILTEDNVEESVEKKWQWVYKTSNSPIWNITQTFLTKEKFAEFFEEYNILSPHNNIVEFRKVKVTKIVHDKK